MNATAPEPGSNRRRRATPEEELLILRDTLTKALISHHPAGPPRQPCTHWLGLSPQEERDALGSKSLLAAVLHRAILDYLMGYTYTSKTRAKQQLELAQEAEDWLWCRGEYRDPQGVMSAPAVCAVLQVNLEWVRKRTAAKLEQLLAGAPSGIPSVTHAMASRAAAGHAAPGRMSVARRHQRS